MQLYNESLKKLFEERIIIQLVRKLQKTLTYYHQTLKLKYYSSLPKVLLNKAVPKKTTIRMKKNSRWRAKSETGRYLDNL